MRPVLAGVLLLLLTAAGAAGASRPQLALVQASPVVVAGSGFAAGRTTSVSYASGGRSARKVARADAHGRLRAVFQGVSFVRCRGARIATSATAPLVVLPCSAPGGKPTVAATIAGFVRGAAFVPGEHVAVTGRLSDSDPVTARLDADAGGSFAARLLLPAERCGELFVRAAGSLGSTATFTFSGPDCKGP